MSISAEHMANLIDNGMSAQEIGETYGYSPSGVRGMVSKWRKSNSTQPTYSVDFQPISIDPSPSEQRLMDIVQRGQIAFDSYLAKREGEQLVYLYTSDQHWPYADQRAISLNIQIAAVTQPDIITDGSDFFDFDDYTHWEDNRTPAARLWGSDIQRPINLHADYHRQMESGLRRKPQWWWLWGNHDMWMYEYLMRQYNGTTIYTLAHVLNELQSHGTIFTSAPTRNHYIKANNRLKLLHGVNASKNAATTAKNTIADYAGKAYEIDAGVHYDVVYGHDHRSGVYKYNGVTAYSAGTNSRTDLPYLTKPADWQQGVVVGRFEVGGTFHHATVIDFFPLQDGRLTCFVNSIQLFS